MSSESDDFCIDCLQDNVVKKLKASYFPPDLQIMFYMREETKRLGMRQANYCDFLCKLLRNIAAYEKDQSDKQKRLREFWGV